MIFLLPTIDKASFLGKLQDTIIYINSTSLWVNNRGYWETSGENLERLQELYQEVEDRIEGVE